MLAVFATNQAFRPRFHSSRSHRPGSDNRSARSVCRRIHPAAARSLSSGPARLMQRAIPAWRVIHDRLLPARTACIWSISRNTRARRAAVRGRPLQRPRPGLPHLPWEGSGPAAFGIMLAASSNHAGKLHVVRRSALFDRRASGGGRPCRTSLLDGAGILTTLWPATPPSCPRRQLWCRFGLPGLAKASWAQHCCFSPAHTTFPPPAARAQGTGRCCSPGLSPGLTLLPVQRPASRFGAAEACPAIPYLCVHGFRCALSVPGDVVPPRRQTFKKKKTLPLRPACRLTAPGAGGGRPAHAARNPVRAPG